MESFGKSFWVAAWYEKGMSIAGLEPRISWLLDWVLARRAIQVPFRTQSCVLLGNPPQREAKKLMSVGKEPYPKVQYPRAKPPTPLANPYHISGQGWKPGRRPTRGTTNTLGLLPNLHERRRRPRRKTREKGPFFPFWALRALTKRPCPEPGQNPASPSCEDGHPPAGQSQPAFGKSFWVALWYEKGVPVAGLELRISWFIDQVLTE